MTEAINASEDKWTGYQPHPDEITEVDDEDEETGILMLKAVQAARKAYYKVFHEKGYDGAYYPVNIIAIQVDDSFKNQAIGTPTIMIKDIPTGEADEEM